MLDPNAKVTPISDSDAGAALTVAWVNATGRVPPEQIGVYLLALIWVETGRGTSVIRYNFGNLSAGGYVGGNEVISFRPFWRPDWFYNAANATHDRMLMGQAPSAFRAYDTAEAGMRAFVGLLRTNRYRPVLDAAMADSPEGFAQALHDTGYSKDYNSSHGATFRSLVAGFRAKQYFAAFKGEPLDPPSAAVAQSTPPKKSSGAGWLLAALAAVAGGAAYLYSRRKGRA